MAAIATELGAAYAFVERNFNLVRRYWGWQLVFLIHSIVQALVIGFVGTALGPTGASGAEGQRLVLYLLVGSLVWTYVATVFEAIGEMISWERWEGTIEYTFMAPVHRLTHMLGTVAFAIVWGILRAALTLLVLALFFHLDLSGADLGAAGVTLVIASLGFVGMGIAVSVLPLLFTERGEQMVMIVQSSILLVSGIFYPVEVMPRWMQAIGAISPATYTLTATRAALLEGRSVGQLGAALLPLLLIGALSIPLGMLAFGWAERYAKRTGRLKRSG